MISCDFWKYRDDVIIQSASGVKVGTAKKTSKVADTSPGLNPMSRDFGPFKMGGCRLQMVLTYCSTLLQGAVVCPVAQMHCPP